MIVPHTFYEKTVPEAVIRLSKSKRNTFKIKEKVSLTNELITETEMAKKNTIYRELNLKNKEK